MRGANECKYIFDFNSRNLTFVPYFCETKMKNNIFGSLCMFVGSTLAPKLLKRFN